MHNHLKEVTRPGSTAAHKIGVSAAKAPENDKLAINFVVFVDDLDRCLPETAVATLELIKTMFNVESFAFVLALDEEIIERGIGHRYSAYVLKDKKPQMPITGFEYLEKIVHLPFRLPALTTAQAQRVLCGREALIESDEGKRWFRRLTAEQLATARTSEKAMIEGDGEGAPKALAVWWEHTEARSDGKERTVDSDSPHLRLVLASFEAFVPRKLLRIVELWQQIVRVNAARTEALFSVPVAQQAPGLTWNRRSPEGDTDGLDTRVVFALVLLQLFQPDLYRFMRRRPEAFPALLGAFMAPDAVARRALLGHRVADVDLWRWACRHGDQSDDALEGVNDLAAARVHIAKPSAKAPASADKGASAENSQAARYMAERVRLGVVERLVEHHAAQRHLFSPLRMFHELANQLPFAALEEISRLMDRYFAVLAQVEAAPISVAAGTGENASATLTTEPESKSGPPTGGATFGTPTVSRNEFAIADIPGLAAALLSNDPAQRANLRERFELREGALLREHDALSLADHLQESVPGNADMTLSRISALGAIAPWLSWSSGGQAVVAAVVGLEPDDGSSPNAESQITTLGRALANRHTQAAPKLRAELGDLLNRFAGGDPRFDPSNPMLMAAKWGNHSAADEPIPGFVRIPDGAYPLDETGKKAPLKESFLIARTATTVAQFARFIESRGFVANEKRRIELPTKWEEQVRFGNRPVWGVNWYTARAYCDWLSNQALEKDKAHSATLPTEWQWQCAARLLADGKPHAVKFPWGGSDESEISRYGNTAATGIKRVVAVGSFEPTGPGLYDMAGNVWEWMDNDWAEGIDPNAARIGRTAPKHPARRGGSWLDLPEFAACSYRGRLPPGYWGNDLGFRVVLSLAKSEA